MTASWFAPGRVNLIGEHTDYNDGFVLPFALHNGCTATVTRAVGSTVRAVSAQRGTAVSVDLDDLRPGVGGWAGYVLGVVWELTRRGYPVPGLHIDVDSSVPVGSGLSSSAALVCSTTTAIDDLLGLGLSDADLLTITRNVENEFVGAPTGGMDQLASLRCTVGHALLCDMRTLETQDIALSLVEAGLTLLIVDSGAQHSHVDGEYGARRAGCRRAAELLGVAALRDISMDELADALTRLPDDTLRRYARHVVTENDRVLRTAALLRAGRPDAIGPLLDESHVSMRDDYRITVVEVDVAAQALKDAGALGARMTGGGFGGCVIGLVRSDDADSALAVVRDRYAALGFAPPRHFSVRNAAAGAHRVVPSGSIP